MNVIVAVTKDWGIGKDGDQLFYIPQDLAFFRKTTLNKVVIFGRKTLSTFPGQRALAQRENIVLTRNLELSIPNCMALHNIPELLSYIKAFQSDDIFVIGGQAVYESLLPYCSTAYVTHIDTLVPATHFFPDLSASAQWSLVAQSDVQHHETLTYRFCTYQNSQPQPL